MKEWLASIPHFYENIRLSFWLFFYWNMHWRAGWWTTYKIEIFIFFNFFFYCLVQNIKLCYIVTDISIETSEQGSFIHYFLIFSFPFPWKILWNKSCYIDKKKAAWPLRNVPGLHTNMVIHYFLIFPSFFLQNIPRDKSRYIDKKIICLSVWYTKLVTWYILL